jgi:phenylacetyl-CoA:acceptor oxidoreductase subunit 2
MSRSKLVLDKVSPRLQRNWDVRAATNFIGGGAGGGLLAATAIASFQGDDLRPLVVLALALVGLGLTAVWLEIGRPFRALNVYRNVATSWMTREAMIAPVMFACGGAAVLFGQMAALLWSAGVVGVVYAYAQGRILRANKGIPAWRQPSTVALMVATGLTEGAGIVCAAALYWPALSSLGILLAVLVCVRFLAWRIYLKSIRGGGAPSGTLNAFAAIENSFVWLGHVAPLLLCAAAVFVASQFLVALAGILAAAAGVWFKYTLVCRAAAFTQGFALPWTPSRGASAPGKGDAPGWTRAPGSYGGMRGEH